MDWVTVINTSVGLMSLGLGALAIWLSLTFYSKAKESEKETARALEAIKAQSEALQKLTGRWMDRFTRHATEPRPADEGLMQLVNTVASLPTTILAQLQVVRPQTDAAAHQVLMREAIDGYVGLYYYSALSNVVAQALLPSEESFDSENELHIGIRAIVDRSAADFQHMTGVLQRLDSAQLNGSSLLRLLDEAIQRWRPNVRYTSQIFEARQQQ